MRRRRLPPLPPRRRYGVGAAPPPRRRRGRRLLGLLGIAAAGAGLVYLARRDAALRELSPPGFPPAEPERDSDLSEAAPPAGGRFVALPAGSFFVRVAGDLGPALVLVHGLGGSSAHWRPQLATLSSGLRTFAPDLRGHGRSPHVEGGAYDVAAHAGDVLAMADALGLDRFALAGHSFGAWVALEIAAAHPERVTALALVDPGGDTSEVEGTEAALAAVAADPRNEFTMHYREFLRGGRPATARRVMADLEATPVEALVAGLDASMRYPARARLAAYTGPVLCLATALNDAPGSLTRTVANLATEWLAPASHWVMLDRPEQTSGLLSDLVGAATSRG
jgi:pimeloyl-ACP methyl ester carboxylesterase